jgi:HSP20 family molecular chaperone IbpA
LSFDDDFGDIFEGFDLFKFARKSHSELERILERIEKGEMKGTWEVRKIDEPNLKGYTIRGHFGMSDSSPPLEPIEPSKPFKKHPSPSKLLELPRTALKENREPLVDIFGEDKALKIYVELPGVEKDDISLKFNEGFIEINARNFHKKIPLHEKQLLTKAASIEYKNGVLHITLPKAGRLREKDEKNLKAI